MNNNDKINVLSLFDGMSCGQIALNKIGEFIEVKPVTNINVVDTVGAGDAFAAVLLLGGCPRIPTKI